MPSIKISGITNNDDAKWAAILGVEYVTVSMDEASPKKVSLQKAIEIRNMLPSYTRFIAEYGTAETIDRKELLKLNPGWIQLKTGVSEPAADNGAPGEPVENENTPEEASPELLEQFMAETQIPVILEHDFSSDAYIPAGASITQLNLDRMITDEELERLSDEWDMDKTIIHADWQLPDIKKACRVIQPLAWSIKSVIEKSPRKIDYPVMKKYIREISLW